MIKSLQSLRFFFALMIFCHHFFMKNPQVEPFGTFSVVFFFILSGFVMTIGYADKVYLGSFCYKSYIAKRLIRIFPLNTISLALFLIIPIAVDLINQRISLTTYIFAILDFLMVQAWIPIQKIYFSCNAVAWFLSDMLFCYFMFPFLVKWLKGKYGIIIMASVLFVYFVTLQFMSDKEIIHAYIYINPLFRIIDFMIGIMLCLLLKPGKKKDRKPLVATLMEMGVMAIAVLSLVVYPYIPIKYSYVSFYWIPSVLLIIVFTLSDRLGGAISTLISRPTLVYLGTLSFPFYMFHLILIGWYKIIESRISVNTMVGALLCILVTILLAHIYVKKVEPIIIKRLKTTFV